MKKSILTSVILFFCGFCYAQQAINNVPTPQKQEAKTASKKVQNPAAFACPKCFTISKGTGNCANCNAEKIQLGTFYCATCNKTTGTKPGKCASCGASAVQMTRKLCGQHQHNAMPKKAA